MHCIFVCIYVCFLSAHTCAPQKSFCVQYTNKAYIYSATTCNACMLTNIQWMYSIHGCTDAFTHTCIHVYIHIYTYMHVYVKSCLVPSELWTNTPNVHYSECPLLNSAIAECSLLRMTHYSYNVHYSDCPLLRMITPWNPLLLHTHSSKCPLLRISTIPTAHMHVSIHICISMCACVPH